MNENQESDSNSIKTYDVLERNIQNAKEEKEQAEIEYHDLHNKIENLKGMLQDYLKHQEEVPHKYDMSITMIFLILMVLVTSCTVFLLGNLTLKLLLSNLWMFGIGTLVGIPVIGYTELKFFKKIQEVIVNKIQNKVIGSDEYQVILYQIETIREDLKNAENDELTKKINMKDAAAKYSGALGELKLKESMQMFYNHNENVTRVRSNSYVRKRKRY